MKKIVRLTESDLVRLVNRVISEQVKTLTVGSKGGAMINPGGNRPGHFDFVVKKVLGSNKYMVTISKWEFGSDYAKVGDSGTLTVGNKDATLNINGQVIDQLLMDEKKLGNVKPLVNEQVLQGIKNFVNKGINMVTGKTGNKFFDAAIGAKLGKMQDGKTSNEKLFCYDDSCENSITIFSDGRAVFEQAEFDKKTKGKMIFNSDGSFMFQWEDGGKSKKHFPK
jgi:hypothetical protein